VLLACADGEAPAEEDLDALADIFLEHPDVRAAREVRDRGPWALTRAIQLAEKVLQRHPAATSTSLGKVRSSSGPTRHGRRR
jgi:hypothetical protein